MVEKRIEWLASACVIVGLTSFGCRREGARLPAPGGGEIRGQVTSVDRAFVPLSRLQVRLYQGTDLVAETVVATGEYSFRGLSPGSYRIEGETEAGEGDDLDVDVADGITTTVHFFRHPKEPSKGLFAFKPAVAAGPGSGNPDLTADGVVNLDDLAQVERCLGQDPQECNGDVNRDDRIDSADVELVKASFERNVLRVPGMFGARVLAGGSVATIGEDRRHTVARIVSEEGGLTEFAIEPTAEPTKVSARVVADRGTASSKELGTVIFAENPDRPSTAVIDLESGRLVTGELTLRVSGEAFSKPVDVAAPIALGQLVFAPHGFRLYHVLIVGVLDPAFPKFGGLAFRLDECNPPKADVGCAETLATPEDPRCNGGGTACAAEGAACASNGSQGTCTTEKRKGVQGKVECTRCFCS